MMATDITIMGSFAPLYGGPNPQHVWDMESRVAGTDVLWLDIKTGTDNDRGTLTLFFERLTVDEVDHFLESMAPAEEVLRKWNDARRTDEAEANEDES